MSRGRPVFGVACATLLLGGAYLAGGALEAASRKRLVAEAERAAGEAVARARDPQKSQV
jgi:hypothetical protein